MGEQLEEVNKFYNIIVEFIVNYSMQVVGALIIIILGVVLSKYIQKLLLGQLLKHSIDETISKFSTNLVRFLIIAMTTVIALGKLGISVGPFVAALGAFSLTAGLALQGSVSNFAAGLVLILTKPFKIGDTLTVHNLYGKVQDIKLAYTLLVNEDDEEITIPNKYMIGDVLVNSFENRVVEGSIGISYSSDVSKAIETIKKVIENHDGVSKENTPIIGIEKFDDSALLIAYRYWVPSNLFYKMQYEVNLNIFEALKKSEISIPFPQREIKIIGENSVK